MNIHGLVKGLVLAGSLASIAFGIWHFFVPGLWHWYTYIDAKASELILAVRAINVFFSLSLVLFGSMNILLAWGGADRYAVLVVLAATCILWLTRLALQLIYPQGSIQPALQYGMLAAFIVISLCYLAALGSEALTPVPPRVP
jgi:hypothetical protein